MKMYKCQIIINSLKIKGKWKHVPTKQNEKEAFFWFLGFSFKKLNRTFVGIIKFYNT